MSLAFVILGLNNRPFMCHVQKWREGGRLTAIILKGAQYLILNNHIPFNHLPFTFHSRSHYIRIPYVTVGCLYRKSRKKVKSQKYAIP